MPSLAELRKRYLEQGRALPKTIEQALRQDPRRGASVLLDAIARKRKANRAEGQRLRRMRRFEEALLSEGYTHIAGVDEAGMSPLAGPVVAAAVILPATFRTPGVDDSKKVPKEQREALAAIIKQEAIAWGIGRAEPQEIDRINIYHAGLLAMRRAVEALQPSPDYLLIDARTLKDLAIPQQGIVRGDAQSLSIAAASILAKTTRDAIMTELDARFPGYGLAQHKGYPVKAHVAAIAELGVLPIHRRSFTPVKEALGLVPKQISLLE